MVPMTVRAKKNFTINQFHDIILWVILKSVEGGAGDEKTYFRRRNTTFV